MLPSSTRSAKISPDSPESNWSFQGLPWFTMSSTESHWSLPDINWMSTIITRYETRWEMEACLWSNYLVIVTQLLLSKCKCLRQHGIVIMTCCPHILLSYKGGTIWANIYHRCLFFLTECKYFSLIYVIKRRPSSYRRRVEKLVSEGASSCFLTLISLKVPPTLLLMGMAHHKVWSLTFTLPFPGLKGED